MHVQQVCGRACAVRVRALRCRGAVTAAHTAPSEQSSPPRGRLLVLGGSGFVGRQLCSRALADGWSVVSLSRRGQPEEAEGLPAKTLASVDWRRGDATDPDAARTILQEGGFRAVFHCMGMLFAGDLNRLVSGSGSLPSPGATYDAVTRQSALAAAAAAAELCERSANGAPPPFGFVSAAEAAWSFDAPLEWLRLYLAAKKSVERELLDGYGATTRTLRPIILRPSLVYSPDRPAALPAVAAFWAANALGLPGVDRPVSVDTLAAAAVSALGDERASGVLGFREMEDRAAAAAAAAAAGSY